MPSTGGETDIPGAPHSKKAARALHRTAFHTTADFAVPPLYLTLIAESGNGCVQPPQYWNATVSWAPSMARGMAMRTRDR
jgi:hypothetical protein